MRTLLATVQGAAVSLPSKARQTMIDLNSKVPNGYGISAINVVNAINAQNLIASGMAKIGKGLRA